MKAFANGCVTTLMLLSSATYSGMLPGTLGGQFSDEEMRVDLAALTERAGANLILADTTGLDLATGEIQFSDHASVCFDALSIGVGSMPVGWENFLKVRNTGDGKALLEYGPFTAHARWCRHWKTWIDKRFIGEFQMDDPSPIPACHAPRKVASPQNRYEQ